ncbi:hypothetical protein PanWU01x14_046890 [Parasponia andersonii]|uniref:Uncharacterized protein n=1 Tax=Parasponia andersonii TaxID=3476 RepID=A0A2P5DNV5_PARAD|nr:hypothetical protein PanWU01x14_046890 [Parasponia andersonii]
MDRTLRNVTEIGPRPFTLENFFIRSLHQVVFRAKVFLSSVATAGARDRHSGDDEQGVQAL